jgi:hypothetical protein
VIDEGAQLWHHLAAVRIVEEYARRHRRKRLQHMHEFPRFHRSSGDRFRQLRKTQAFDGRAKHGGKVVGDEGPRYCNLDHAAVVVERP